MSTSLYPSTLDLQLWNAAAASYLVTASSKNGTYDPTEGKPSTSYYVEKYKAAFGNQPATIICGQFFKEKTTAVMIVETESNIIASFRGTLPPCNSGKAKVGGIVDWLEYYNTILPVSNLNRIFPGKVMPHLAIDANKIRSQFFTALGILKKSDKPIYFTGHSKGGGLASLMAMEMYTVYNLKIENVITFGSPSPGDHTFSQEYTKIFPKALRYANYCDPIAVNPPDKKFCAVFTALLALDEFSPINVASGAIEIINQLKHMMELMTLADYTPAGNLRFIDKHGHVLSHYPDVDKRKMAEILLKDIFRKENGIAELMEHHSSHNKKGYNRILNLPLSS